MLQVCKAEADEPVDILLFMFFGVGVGIIVHFYIIRLLVIFNFQVCSVRPYTCG